MIISNYSFSATDKKITFHDRQWIDTNKLALITNLTTGEVIYQFQRVGKGITDVDGAEITLEFDTSTMDNTDVLRIDLNEETTDRESKRNKINEYNSTIAIVPKTAQFGPYVLTANDQTTEVIDLASYPEVNMRFQQTSGDFIQLDFSHNGFDGWQAKGTLGLGSGNFVIPRYARFFRAHRITTSANPQTIMISVSSTPSQFGQSTFGLAVTTNPIVNAMRGLNDVTRYLNSARATADANSGDDILAGAQYLYVGTNSYAKKRGATVSKSPSSLLTSAGDNDVWQPASGKKWRLMKYRIVVMGNSTLSSAGIQTFTFKDENANTSIVEKCYVPATALNNSGVLFDTGLVDLDNGIISATADNTLELVLGTAFNAGGAHVLAIGMEE